jgi:hypothetical protein
MEPQRIQAAGAHVRECAECAAAVDRSAALARSAAELWDAASRSDTASRRSVWALAAAAMLALILAAAWWLAARSSHPRPSPVPPSAQLRPLPAAQVTVLRDGPHRIAITGGAVQPAYGREDWNGLARRAISSGRIDVARLAELHPAGEHVRGTSDDPQSGAIVAPAGITVASQRPELRWDGPADATAAVVIAAADGTIVARQDGIYGHSWIPPRPLHRGRTYSWQVTLRDRSGRTSIVPPAPAPPALFAVLNDATAGDAEAARANGAHLIAALLYARAGAQADAEQELRFFVAANPGAALRLNVR